MQIHNECIKKILQKSKRFREGGKSYLLTKFTCKEWKCYWLTECINKKWLYVSHNHLYLSISQIMWHLPCHCYLYTIPCMWTLLASSFIHPSLHLFDFCKKLFYKFLCRLFNKNCYTVLRTHLRRFCMCTCGWAIILARAPMNGFQQLIHSPPSFYLQTRAWGKMKLVPKKLKMKMIIPGEFPIYWWLFQMQHFLHLSTRLAEEEEKDKHWVWPH